MACGVSGRLGVHAVRLAASMGVKYVRETAPIQHQAMAERPALVMLRKKGHASKLLLTVLVRTKIRYKARKDVYC